MRPLLVILLAMLTGGAAAAPRPLRVLTYNIHAGKDADAVVNLERVADVVKSTRADVVLLQEVDRRTKRSGNVDHLAELQRLTGLNAAFAKALDWQGGDYGIAILSRWPIAAQEAVPLRAEGSIEPRMALVVSIDRPGRKLTVINTHLDASDEDTWRRQELVDLLAAIAKHRPLLVGGDFNSTPDSAVQQTLRESGLIDLWSRCGKGSDLTYPANTPVKRIDYLFLNGKAPCTTARVLNTQASDHRPVLFELTLP
jgi:endonuclease/exonuclease/phosphatase family metal-dependent hydrolase